MPAERGAETFDPHYQGYEAWKGWTAPFTYTEEEAEYFSGEMRGIPLAGKALLEIGFGSGSFLAWAKAGGATVTGTEINPVLLDAARGASVALVETPIEQAAGALRERFDVIVSFDVFEHFTLEEIDARLAAAEAMLRPGGHLVLRFPNGQSPFGLLPQNADVTHKTALSKDKIEQLCHGRSLDAVRYAGSYRVRGPMGGKRLARALRSLARDLIAAVLNRVYACDIPWDAVVVLVMQKRR